MKFALASDLHFEFHRDGGKTLVSELPETDTVVVAGDLASSEVLWDSLMLMLRKYLHVVYVYGNHEFYGSSFQAVRQNLNKLLHRLPKMRASGETLGELHILDNSTVEIEGQRFVGTTLWFRQEPGIEMKHNFLNDFRAIQGANPRIYEENVRALAFLEEEVKPTDVVVTHHLPHEGSISPEWKGSHFNCFFLCEMEPLIRDRKPKLWLHGHTHSSHDYHLHETRVVCNPFGYASHEENSSFVPQLIIECL